MIKKCFKLSTLFLILNLFLLVFIPIMFVIIFNLFPNLNGTGDGLGAYPLLCVILGGYGLFLTVPFFLIMLCIHIFYPFVRKRFKND